MWPKQYAICEFLVLITDLLLKGQGMVPIADLFNHKAAVVALSDEYQIEKSSDDEAGTESDGDDDDNDEVDHQNGTRSHGNGQFKQGSIRAKHNRILPGMHVS